MRLTRRAALGGLAGAAAAALAPPALGQATADVPGDAPKTVRIGFQKNGTFLIAKLRGTVDEALSRAGIAVEWREFPFGPPLVEALNVGAIDLGSVGDTPPIFAQAARSKFVYAATHAATGCGIIAPNDSGLRSVEDLKGKRVSIPKGSSAHNVTVAALEQAGLSFKDIEPVYLAPADGQAAFRQGAVDAWTVWDPFFALAEEQLGARLIKLATDVAPQNSFVLAARDFASARPKTLGLAIREIGAAGDWADAHREEAARLYAEATGTPLPAQLRAVARGRYGVRSLDAATIATQQRSADRFYALGLIPARIDVAEAVWRG